MMLFGSLRGDLPELAAGRIRLRLPAVSDFAVWAAERADSAAFLKPYEPIWPADDLTRPAFRRRVRRNGREARERTAFAFLLFRAGDGALLGGLTLSNVRYGVARSCFLGYWMGRRHAGQGYMREAVALALDFAFDELGLHRVEASTLVDNARSIGLLKRSGFAEEGLARAYLLIDGRWQDHLRFACVNPRD
jgi:ribosomal-protein-alanine N-acetyltransferase